MPPATIPEASVNEYGQMFTSENKVRAAGNRLVATPTGDTVSPQDEHQPQLGLFVSFRPDRSHDLGAFLPAENVCHFFED